MKSIADVRPAANRLFKSRDGEVVLEHLLDKFYHCKFKDESLVRQVGHRDVLLYLSQLLAEDKHVQK